MSQGLSWSSTYATRAFRLHASVAAARLGGTANHNVVAVHLEGMLVLDHHLLDGEEGGDNHLLHLGKEPNRERWRIELAPNVA